MSIVEKLLNMGVGLAEKAGSAGKGKSVGKVGDKFVHFGSTLAKLGKDVSAKDAPAQVNDNVGVKKVKLSRGGLEVEISYPKSLLDSKGSSYAGKDLSDPAILHELSDKKVSVKGKSEKETSGSSDKTNGVGSDKNQEQNVLESLKAGTQKKVVGDSKANVEKSLGKEASVGSSNEASADKKGVMAGSAQNDKNDKSVLKEVKSEDLKDGSIPKKIDEAHAGKKNQTENENNSPATSNIIRAAASNGVANQAGKLPSKDNPDALNTSASLKGKKNEPAPSSQVVRPAINSNGTGTTISDSGKSAVTHEMLPNPTGNAVREMVAGSVNISKNEKVDPSKGKSTGPDAGKLKTVKTSQDAPNVVRDRYYGQRIVKSSSPQVNEGPKDHVQIKGSSKAVLHNNHVSGSDGLTGTVDSKSVNSPLSTGGHKQRPGSDSNGQAQAQQTPANKVKSDAGAPKIDPTGNGTVSHAQSAQTGNNAASITAPAQVNVPHVVAERLVSLVQKSSQPDQPQTWQKHRLVMDNGQTLNVSERTSDGILHLQLSGGNQDLNKLLQQHMQEIQNHLQEKMHVQVDLQFQNQSNGQPAQQFQQQSGNGGAYHRPTNISSNDFDERTAEPKERPLSNRRLGYNNTEWTA
ncbi:MAG TPA: hypothetical protein VKA08_10005 [Balneolales bacterium]|nr:hypothetical protein [Balneolales bacterium]